MTLCRSCHSNVHEGRWELISSSDGLRVVDRHTGDQVMRRLMDSQIDVAGLLHLLNLAEDSLIHLFKALPFFSDDELVEAYSYASSFGKRSWMAQASIIYEAQRRSIHGEQTLEAISRRFNIGIRHTQKYALVWKIFFATNDDDDENVNIDVYSLDEPSWYVVAATETKDPQRWLAYAQDRKAEDPRYSVVAFRRDIQLSRLIEGVEAVKALRDFDNDIPQFDTWACPWVKLLCVQSGKPTPFRECQSCEFRTTVICDENSFVRED